MTVWNEGQMNKAEKMFVPKGFLREIYEMLCKRYPRMNKDYLLSIAELLLSSASWNVYTIDSYGALAPNIWYHIVIPSGEGKSLPIDYFLVPTIEALERKMETDGEVYKLYLADYTKEGIIKHFTNTTTQVCGTGKNQKKKRVIYTFGIMIKDEATMFLNAAQNKGYMADIIGVESKMYDGILYRRVTASRDLEEVPRCFKASISATTKAVYKLMSMDAFIQGGWNRYDPIIGNPTKPEDVQMLDEKFFFDEGAKDELQTFEKIHEEYADKLLKLTCGAKVYVMMDANASLLWRKYELETKQEAAKMDDNDLRRGYMERQAEKALKRAMLYTVSLSMNFIDKLSDSSFLDYNGNLKNEKMLLVGREEMEIAIANQRELYNYWLMMLEGRKKSYKDIDVTTDSSEIEFFEMHCKALGEEFGIFSRKQLLDVTQWHDGGEDEKSKLKRNIVTAVAKGHLKEYCGTASRDICDTRRLEAGAVDWFKQRDISTSYKIAPYLYEWVKK